MYSRQRWGRGFTYRYEDGSVIKNKDTRDWIESLVIPPAWQEVQISEDRTADRLVEGRDAAGRKQYIYHENYRARQQEAKYDRMLKFAERLEVMRVTTGKHLRKRKLTREKVLACMVRLLDTAYFRVGSLKYAKQNGSYGLSTLRRRHLVCDGEELIFHYDGKSGQEQERSVVDRQLCKVVNELAELPGYRLFKYESDSGEKHYVDSDELNEYISQIMGEQFSAKDFRTWGGTVVAATTLSEMDYCDSTEDQQDCIREAVKKTAERLGNTPAIAKESYVDPRVLSKYSEGVTTAQMDKQIKAKAQTYEHLSEDELRVICLLSEAA